MKWFEIIHLRASAVKDKNSAITAFSHIKLVPLDGNGAEITLLEDLFLSTDLRVIIKWRKIGATPSKSTLGLRLAAALSTYGMIHHTVWVACAQPL